MIRIDRNNLSYKLDIPIQIHNYYIYIAHQMRLSRRPQITAKRESPDLQLQDSHSNETGDEIKIPTFRIRRKQYYKKYENHKTIWQKTVVTGEIFELPSYFKVQKQIGYGSYGVVVSAQDTRQSTSTCQVAIKKMVNVFDHKVITKRILREIRILRLLHHQNIIELIQIILPKSRDQFDEIYLVFPLIDFNLREVINSDLCLKNQYCQLYLYQILRGLKFLHSANIIHRDLKPRNILINDQSDLKLCDFGMARFYNQKSKIEGLTDQVTTRLYRAPEVLKGCLNYSTAIDIWSVGCILVQMIKKEHFMKASDSKEQLQLIMEILGTDKEKKKPFSEKINPFDSILPTLTAQGKDLLMKMLALDPENRITAVEALRHPYLKGLHLQEDENQCHLINQLQFEFEQHQLSLNQLKDIIYEQILLGHFHQFRQNYELKKKQRQSLIEHIVNSHRTKIL